VPIARFAPLLLLGLALGIVGGTASLMVSEAAPYLAVAGTEAARFQALADGALQPGPSVVSKKLVLDECYTASKSLYGKVQPTARRGQMLESCRAIATEITASTPSFGYGWYVMALLAAEQHDRPGLNAALARAQATAPNEGWLGELRIGLAAEHLAELDPAVREGNDRDLTMLVLSVEGVAAVARLYVERPELREHITSLVEALDDDTQRRFLRAVRQATAAA
jgi:hypothetical protein